MAIQRLPIVTSTDPEESISSLDYGTDATNVIFDRYSNGKVYATQRPGYTVIGDPDDYSLDSAGRGIYYWDKVGSFYIVNNDTVSAGYGLPIGTISEGRDRVYFTEVGEYLMFTDPENNEGWYIEASDPYTITSISDTNFPSNQGGEVALAHGAVTLDNYGFVLDVNGVIWQSDFGDPTSWNALDFIEAERESDKGVFITKHHDQIVVIGADTIEFFYNAGNATGSTLSRRQDVSYRTGSIGSNATFASGDIIYFLGLEKNGSMGLYSIENFTLSKKSNMSMDRALTNLGLESSYEYILTFSLVNDHYLVFISGATSGTGSNSEAVWDNQITYVYDATTNFWEKFQFNGKAVTGFPVMALSDRTRANIRSATLLLSTGDILTTANTLEPQDGVTSTNYFEEDFLVDNDDYVEAGSASSSTNISIEIITPEWDGGTTTRKYAHYMSLVGTLVSQGIGDDNISISWSDDHGTTYTTARSLSTDMLRKLTRCGSFRRRMHKIAYSGADTLRIEEIELELRASRYA